MSLHFLPYCNHRNFSLKHKDGFGLIELMVSISIMLIVSSVILARQSAFNGAVLLRSQLYEVALAVREVQLSAVSAESNGSGSFGSVQGIYFDTATSNNGSYVTFHDMDGDFFYDSNEQFGKQGLVDKRFEVRAIRAIGGTINGTGVAVVFKRPNFDAQFYSSTGKISASSIEVDISKRGNTGTTNDVVRTLEITATGQITVK